MQVAGMILPEDGVDPPELEVYKLTPFRLGAGSSRLAAHAMLYAPRPTVLGRHYGLMFNGSACKSPKPEDLLLCHGPHMYTERFIGPGEPGADPTNFSGWSRPFRRNKVAPADLSLVAGPVSLPAAVRFRR